MKKYVKPVLSGLVIAATAAAFVWYVQAHPDYITKLRHTDWRAIVALIAVNGVLIVVLAGIYQMTARIAGKSLGRQENLLLTIYSSIANFFGPLQSGPGVRAVYLKKRHQVRLRDYTFATLIYYAMYAVVSALFALIGTRPWWQTLLAVGAAAGASAAVLYWFDRRGQKKERPRLRLVPRLLGILLLLTALQISLVSVRYYIELQTVQANVSVGQAVSYAGAANFALFVSVTPDGIGIREAFLLFSQRLHGVETQYIVAASLLDRATYILFLGLLFLVALTLHAKDKLRLPPGKKSTPEHSTSTEEN
jgi:uncharacterized membrane protein YbhN (UPF0104 family)